MQEELDNDRELIHRNQRITKQESMQGHALEDDQGTNQSEVETKTESIDEPMN